MAERRVAELAPARSSSSARKPVDVVPGGMQDGRRVGLERLHDHLPGASRPLRPASCVTSWNVRSSARKSGIAIPVSASTTAASGHPGEVVALRHHLRPEQDGAVGGGEAAERLARARPASPPCRRRGGSAPARGRASRARARAAGCRRRSAPAPADPHAGQCSGVGSSAAVVAVQPAVAVQHQRDVAVPAAAGQRRRRGSGSPARPRGG